ncbi:rhamnosyltransferase [Ruminococcus sp. YE71]|uniref:glycosyltransferase n=1 Tax=unclassified Ruminococcus TaxID=2608920 RepID=UPI0008868DE7|nr:MULTISPECIES: glycosyltransferase [unclassified Ruminococcus]SDA30811.1 rhamnosyltransferase [Ruminococcus sp. YE78]SFW50511.1 rhamnosyltransferase [Ruminococcus sp. YE71]
MKKNKRKSAAVIVLYNPCDEVIGNIKRYNELYDFVICVDNSSYDNSCIFSCENIKYYPLMKNHGIAFALNFGCKKAISKGAKIITTFDQDTVPTEEAVKSLIHCIDNTNELLISSPRIKIIYRDSHTNNRIFSNEIVKSDKKPIWVITSGSTFSKETYLKIGGFDNKLFISQVDQDFCYRLYKHFGYIKLIDDAYIYQEPGQTKKKNLWIKEIHIPNLTAFRYYYIFRNERYLRKKWGKPYKRYRVNLVKYLISIVFFENNKFNKLYNCLRGFYKGGRM